MPGGNSVNPGGIREVRPGGSSGDNPKGDIPVGIPRKDKVISGEMVALTAACCKNMNWIVGDKVELLLPARLKLFEPIPGVRIVPGGNWGFNPEEGLITLVRVVLNGP
jgi:hypothetical protein